MLLSCLLFLTLASAAPDSGPVTESWREIWRGFGVDPAVAEAIVWPEMQHYSYTRDFAETLANRLSYVAEGGGTNYSIGIFQMKPSFVEKLEMAWHSSGFAELYNLPFDTSGSAAARRARMDRMTVNEWQVIYLGMFLRLLYYSYGSVDEGGTHVQDGIEALPAEEQVRIAANAYNRGCRWTGAGAGNLDSLRVNIDARLFPRVIIPSPEKPRYCYSALALEHYKALVE